MGNNAKNVLPSAILPCFNYTVTLHDVCVPFNFNDSMENVIAVVFENDDDIFNKLLIYRDQFNGINAVAQERVHGVSFHFKDYTPAGSNFRFNLCKEYVIGDGFHCVEIMALLYSMRVVQQRHQGGTPSASKVRI